MLILPEGFLFETCPLVALLLGGLFLAAFEGLPSDAFPSEPIAYPAFARGALTEEELMPLLR